MRKEKIVKLLAGIGLAGLLLALGIACGGGGSSSAVNTTAGTGFKGPVMQGDVTVYGLAGNTLEGMAQLGTAITDNDGKYTATLAGFSGNVMVALAGGTYTDEATGNEKDNTLLHALVPDVSGSISAMVTPFTEISYRLWLQLLGTPDELTIEQANAVASYIAGTANILGTDPALATDTDKTASALRSQLEYGLAAAMLSQYANDVHAGDMDTAIDAIVTDLLDNMTLDGTGNDLITALDKFLTGAQNESGINGTYETFIDDTLTIITDASYDPGIDLGGLARAKELVSDIRDTSLLLYNYSGSGAPGILDPFYNKVAEDIQAHLPYELPERIYILIKAAMQVDVSALLGGTPQAVMIDGVTVTFTYAEPAEDEITLTFKMEKPVIQTEETAILGQGTIAYAGDTTFPEQNPGESDMDYFLRVLDVFPLEGTVAGSFLFGQTAVSVDIDASLNGTFQSLLQQGTLTLTMEGESTVTTGVVSGEIHAMPVEEYILMQSEGTTVATLRITDDVFYPTRIVSNGTTTLGASAEIEGSIAATFVLNSAMAEESFSFLPDSLVVNGTITELESDAPAVLTGSLTAGLANAATYDPLGDWTADNYAQWNAVFNGTVSRTGMGTVTVLLSASQSAENAITFGSSTGYRATTPDGRTVFLQGGGTYIFPETSDLAAEEISLWESDYGTFEAEFTNQTGMKLSLSSELSVTALELEGPVIGYVKTAGGEEMGTVTLREDGPHVKYIDGYGEYIFPVQVR